MKTALALVVLAGCCHANTASDFEVPIDGGTFSIWADFITSNTFSRYYPELTFRITNETESAWRTAKFRFDIGMVCGGLPRQVSFEVETGAIAGNHAASIHHHSAIELKDRLDGCSTELIDGTLIEATRFPDGARVIGQPKQAPEMTEDLKRIELVHDAEMKRADAERAAEAKRQQGLEADRQREAQKMDETIAQAEAELHSIEAKENEERRKVCSALYKRTADKRILELTVKESQAVEACTVLGIYRP